MKLTLIIIITLLLLNGCTCTHKQNNNRGSKYNQPCANQYPFKSCVREEW